ncbi:DUF6817 domain-containing protein [Streptomyces sp. 4F14]|uniref:DUF6817 domain-containing protein n=1 Tax=Streptomyces sp. 4F14 TaxID=3394380 RepID=UPI003A84D0C7
MSRQELTAVLTELGAAAMPHPGGTLLTHLHRVHDRLAGWGARDALQLAGLAHAFYGTDGFPHPLRPPDRRTELIDLIGAEAEAAVHLYASCDRAATYPHLTGEGAPFRDRFTGRTFRPDAGRLRDFAELTVANELDLAAHDSGFREKWGPELLVLFTRCESLLTPACRGDVRAVL